MWFFFKMTNPKLNIFIKGGKLTKVASVWYAFVVKTNNNNSYIIFEQTQTRQFLQVAFTFLMGKYSKVPRKIFFLIFLQV